MTDTIPTPQELADVAQVALRAELDPSGTGTPDLHDGSRLTALVGMQTAAFARVARYAADRATGSRASTASGDDLDVVASDDYGLPRKAAAKATGTVQLSRPGGAPATGIPIGSRFAAPATESAPAVMFEATTTMTVLVGEITALVPVRAVEAGVLAGTFNPNTITQIVDPLPYTSWSLIAPPPGTAFGGGADRETDDVLRGRLLLADTEETRTRGTRDAVLTGTLRVPGVRFAVVVEPLNGTLVVYAGDVNYLLPAALSDAILLELNGWRCYGVPVYLRTFNPVTVTVQAAMFMARSADNYDTATISRTARDQIKAYFEGRPHPDEYFREMIQAAAARAHAEVQHVTLATPAADVIRPADTSYGSITVLSRYRVTDDSIRITVSGPLTT